MQYIAAFIFLCYTVCINHRSRFILYNFRLPGLQCARRFIFMPENSPLFGEITAFYALTLPEFHMPFHVHNSFEIMYITAGTCRIFCGNEIFQAEPNHFVFIGAKVPHRLEIAPDHPCSILNLEFTFSYGKGSFPLAELFSKCRDFQEFWKKIPSYRQGTDMRNLGYALKDLISHLQKTPDSSDFLLYLLYSRALAELAYSMIHERGNTGLYYLKKACGYIDRNIHETIRVPELAAYTGINKSYLQSLFSRILGCSIMEYINKKRLEEAAFLLTNSSMNITDIAFAVGYNSRQHFAHTFEKYYAAGPLAYRQLHKRQMTADTGKNQYILENGKTSYQKLIE